MFEIERSLSASVTKMGYMLLHVCPIWFYEQAGVAS